MKNYCRITASWHVSLFFFFNILLDVDHYIETISLRSALIYIYMAFSYRLRSLKDNWSCLAVLFIPGKSYLSVLALIITFITSYFSVIGTYNKLYLVHTVTHDFLFNSCKLTRDGITQCMKVDARCEEKIDCCNMKTWSKGITDIRDGFTSKKNYKNRTLVFGSWLWSLLTVWSWLGQSVWWYQRMEERAPRYYMSDRDADRSCLHKIKTTTEQSPFWWWQNQFSLCVTYRERVSRPYHSSSIR